MDNFQEQYTEIAFMFFNISTFVDPRFKLHSFLSHEEKPSLLKHLGLDNTFVKEQKEDEKPEGGAKKLRGEKQLLHLIAKNCGKPITDSTEKAKGEIERYLDEEPC